MKILISNAVWGADYCSGFAEFSLGSLLSAGNIPELAKRATLTCHVVTTWRDQQYLAQSAAVRELKRYCAVEWELIDAYTLRRPPTGPGGRKYTFLSALQNLAIFRSLDHDAIVFNYADFVWADGSLSVALEMLCNGGRPADAVLAFCLPVDRDSAAPVLRRYKQREASDALMVPPRDAARVAIDHMHREASNRFWDAPRFTVTPSYIMWPVDGRGVVLRAYHQSILAMRVRADDPQFRRGIVRGSLDSDFTGQLAKSGSLAFANDTEKVLVFSLYQTPVDSRLPPGVGREMSLRGLLRADVLPEQRRFAEFPLFFRLRESPDHTWRDVAAMSANLLREFESSTPFDQAAYDKNHKTHGGIPKLRRRDFLGRPVFVRILRVLDSAGFWPKLDASFAAIRPATLLFRRIAFVLSHPTRLVAAVKRRRGKWLGRGFVEIAPNVSVGPTFVARGVWVPLRAARRLAAAIAVEDSSRRATDFSDFMESLRVAEQSLRAVIEEVPYWTEPVRALGRNLWFQGRFEEAISTFAAAEQKRSDMAGAAGLPIDSCVILPSNCSESIGLMGHLDAFVKHKLLTADPRPYYLFAPDEKVVNATFLDYWKEYITVLSKPEEIGSLAALESIYGVNWNWIMPNGKDVLFVHEGIAAVQRAWRYAGRGPLLELREEDAGALRLARVKWGMKDDDRFVCLHVRSTGFYGAGNEAAQQFRNTNIESYYPMIAALQEMGLWVIRMGDPSMQPLDPILSRGGGRIIDYAVSPDKSAALDVALCAECELFVSSPSGLHTVAHAFGRPVCEVNYPIYSGFPWHPGDIFIPQLYFSRANGRVLTLAEILGSDIIHRDHQFLLEAAGISLIPNEPDDIVETVREALSPQSYAVVNADAADRVCAAFDDLNRRHNLSISGRLGRYFAAKHASKLLPAADQS